MAVDIIGTTAWYWSNYIFGSPLIAGIVVLFFLILWGVRMGWSIDVFIVLLVPMIFLLTIVPATGIDITSVWGIVILMGGGLIGLWINSLRK